MNSGYNLKIKKGLFTTLLALCSVAISFSSLHAAEKGLLAGTSKINITPATNEPLHDSIFARSLILEAGGQRLAFVSVDLAIYTNPNLEKIAKQKYGISKLLLCSSHNHSGPKGQNNAFYEERIIRSLDIAAKNMFEAKISAGRKTFPQLGFKRLIVRANGHARESWFSDDHYSYINPERVPFGPVDAEVGVIKIEDTKGQTRAIVMNYACHADLVCANYEISADYPGVATKKVEEAFGNKVNCLFVNGAAGDVAPLFTVPRRTGPDDPFKTDYKPMDRMGEILAYETVNVAKSINPKASEEMTIRFLDDSLQFTGRFNKTAKFDIHVSTVLINDDILIAACPGELFSQLALDWKSKAQKEIANPFLFGYTWSAGTWPNYVADIKGAALGGYGADIDSPTIIQVGAGEIIMNKHLENYYWLSGLMREKEGPSGYKPGPRWIVTTVPRTK